MSFAVAPIMKWWCSFYWYNFYLYSVHYTLTLWMDKVRMTLWTMNIFRPTNLHFPADNPQIYCPLLSKFRISLGPLRLKYVHGTNYRFLTNWLHFASNIYVHIIVSLSLVQRSIFHFNTLLIQNFQPNELVHWNVSSH